MKNEEDNSYVKIMLEINPNLGMRTVEYQKKWDKLPRVEMENECNVITQE